MQNVSRQYKEAMAQPLRNRSYIKIIIGVINTDAQKNFSFGDNRNAFTYFSQPQNVIEGNIPTKLYATGEYNWSKVDGSMFFLPPEAAGFNYYNNGIVTNALAGTIYVVFNTEIPFDIKGFTINFGEEYPTELTIANDNVEYHYENDKPEFVTEDVFNGTTYLVIKPIKMLNEKTRLRIYNLICGIANSFTNENTISYTQKEYVSPITGTIPSQDTTVIVDNQNLYYSPDNADSTLAYMEIGQEISVSFGYDVNGNEDIEWLPETTTYLKTWSANDVQAKFTGTDRFDYLTDKYYDGHYYEEGISLYDLAVAVLEDAGISNPAEYFIDNYLKRVVVNNPLPICTHAEALQIIANAGRCSLSADRKKRIHIQSSFIPEMEITANNQTDYSNVKNILNIKKKDGYAVMSRDFSMVDGSLFFKPHNPDEYYENLGYVSNSISDEEGNFAENPIITINLESIFEAYGITITFRNVAPQEFVIRTYNEGNLVDSKTIADPEINFATSDMFQLFDRMEIEFTKGKPRSRIFVDNILINNVTDYTLKQKTDLTDHYTATRQEKIKSINVERTLYSKAAGTEVDLKSESMDLEAGVTEYTLYLTKPSYEYSVEVTEKQENEEVASDVVCTIKRSNNYYVVLEFDTATAKTVKYTLQGKEYVTEYQWYIQKHNDNGVVKEWSNPLISSISHAKDLEEWLATYYLGDVEYQVPWRGDPRTDANDLYYLETKSAGTQLIRGYENTLQFDGALSATIKARRAVLEWQQR